MAVREGDLTEDQVLRERERAAIMGLALATLPNEAEVRQAWAVHHEAQFPDLDTALDDLERLTAHGRRVSHRALALRLLAKAARRRGIGVLGGARENLARYVTAHVEEGQRAPARPERRPRARPRPAQAPSSATPPPPQGHAPLASAAHPPEVHQVLGALDAVAASTEAPWDVFTRHAEDALGLSEAELRLPVCSDQENVPIRGHRSTRVVTWFSSPQPAADFAAWTDARRWATDCSLFYEAVTPKSPISTEAEEYSEVFTEVVRFTLTKTLTTDLVFTRTVRPPNLYALHFDLPPGGETADILVDRGSLIARHDADLPPEVGTQITAEKCIAFADPAMATWPTLSCDLFWMELTITVALGCAQDH